MCPVVILSTVLATTFTVSPAVSQSDFRESPKYIRSTYPNFFENKYSFSSPHSGFNSYITPWRSAGPTHHARPRARDVPVKDFPEASEPLETTTSAAENTPALEFLYPSGLNITLPGPYPQSSVYLLKFHVNINHEFKGLKRGDWNQDVTLPSGTSWSYTFPDMKLSQDDTVYYWVEVQGRDGATNWFREYKGYQRVTSTSEKHPLASNQPQKRPIQKPKPSSVLETVAQSAATQPAQVSHPGLSVTQNWTEECEMSETSYNNGQRPCSGESNVVPRVEFSTVEQIGGHEPEDKFTVFSHNNIVKNVTDYNTAVEKITPLLLEDRYGPNFVDRNLRLPDCTSKDPKLCSMKAMGYFILPPVISGRETTENTLFFRYGILEVTAKLPTGDWVVPELWLLPKNRVYGNNSGKIVMAMSRGNKELTDGIQDYSSRVLEAGVVTSSGRQMFRMEQSRPWSDDFHKFKLVWTPNMLQFFVDNREIGRIQPIGRVDPFLYESTKMAPFDQEFYLVVGIHIGGERDFPDSLIGKPWKNNDPKDKLNFWRARGKWKPTWNKDTALHVAAVTLTALKT